MTNKNLTSVNFVIDKSGSMFHTASDVIGGFNRFIKDQKLVPGDCSVSLTFFNNRAEVIYAAKPISEVPDLTEGTYVPGGGTAFYDALGSSIKEVGKKLESFKEEDRPGKVIFVILTDGYENCSRDYNKNQVIEMIKHQQEVYSWDFIYIGANLDSEEEAKALGFTGSSLNYDPTSRGTEEAYDALSRGMTSYRSKGVSAKEMFGSAKKAEDVK